MTSARLPAESLLARATRHFFAHTSHVPLVLLILEAVLANSGFYREPDPYLLLLCAAFQAYLSAYLEVRGTPMPLLANITGPLLYSVVEAALEGGAFFLQGHHAAYWAFAVGFGVLQSALPRAPAIMAENILRSSIPLVMYALFEVRLDSTHPSSWQCSTTRMTRSARATR